MQKYCEIFGIPSHGRSQSQLLRIDALVGNNYHTLDLDVQTSHGNLQRPACWTVEQQREFIVSLMCGRPVPAIAVNECVKDGSVCLEVIDGKQRVSSILSFVNGDLTLPGVSYLEMTSVEQRWFRGLTIPCLMAQDMTEQQKIDWFCFLNFKSTPQDDAHRAMVQSWTR